MMAVFADTSYFTALANSQDEWHQAARSWGGALRCRLIVTEYVLLELGNALVRPLAVSGMGEKRSAVQADLPQPVLPDSRTGRAWHRADVLEE
jgi:predicted nucleic acid-binding protein